MSVRCCKHDCRTSCFVVLAAPHLLLLQQSRRALDNDVARVRPALAHGGATVQSLVKLQ